MVRSRRRYCVDILILKELTNVGIGFNGFTSSTKFLRFALEHISIRITERDDSHARQLAKSFNMVLASAIESSDRNANVIVCANHARPGSGREAESSRGEHGCLNEVPAIYCLHSFALNFSQPPRFSNLESQISNSRRPLARMRGSFPEAQAYKYV
jgi:hypothetical protein